MQKKTDFDAYVDYLAHMLDESMICEEKEEKNDSFDGNKKESSKKKDPKTALYKALKTMRPGQVMDFVAKQLGVDVPKFLISNAGHIAGLAVKNGWAKAGDIKDALKGVGSKSKDDNSGIDWGKAEVDENTFQLKCLFDGDSGAKFKEFMKQYEGEMKDLKTEIEEADQKLHDDVKKAGVEIDDEKLDKNGVVVACVIDNKDNKKLKGKELTKKVDDAIAQDEKAAKIIKKSKKAKKALKGIKVDSKYKKMSDDELEKKLKELEEEMKKRKVKTKKASSPKKKTASSKKSAVKKKDEKKKKKTNESLSESLIAEETDNYTVNLKGFAPASIAQEALDKLNIKPKTFLAAIKKCGGDQKTFDSIMKQLAAAASSSDDTSKNFERVIKIISNDKTGLASYAAEILKLGTDDEKIAKGLAVIPDVDLNNISDDISGSLVKGLVDDFSDGLDKEELHDVVKDASKDMIKSIKSSTAAAIEKTDNILKSIDDEDSASDAVKKLVKGGMDPEKAQEKVLKAIEKQDWYQDLDGDAKSDFIDQLDLEATNGVAFEGADSVSTFTKDLTVNGIKVPKDFMDDYQKYLKLGHGPGVDDKIKQSPGMILNAILRKDEKYADLAKALKHHRGSDKAAAAVFTKLENYGDAIKTGDKDSLNVATKMLTNNSVSVGQAADDVAAGVDGPANVGLEKVPSGFARMPDGSKVPSFSYQNMSRQISDLDGIFDDGKVTPEELTKLNGMASKLNEYTEWAAANKDSNDPIVQMKIASIQRLTLKYNHLIDSNGSYLDNSKVYYDGEEAAARLSMPKDVNGKAVAATAKSDTMAQAKEGWKEKLGIGKAFTALGWARLAAKTTGIILNHGKDLINVIDAQAMKNREDKSVIAEIRCIMTNGEESDSKFSDSKFSVRFSTDDFKWHATNLDDRKMKLPEDVIVKKVLDSELGKKFKAACLKKWKSILKPEDKTKNVIPYVLKNYEKLGLKVSGDAKKMLETVKKLSANFKKIEKSFHEKVHK